MDLTWQYNGVAPWVEIVIWCWTNFGTENVYAKWETIHFKHERDYTLFLLRWS